MTSDFSFNPNYWGISSKQFGQLEWIFLMNHFL
jgi:hypothetical protein